MKNTQTRKIHTRLLLGLLGITAFTAQAAPVITRLTPPSALFSFGDAAEPFIARFLPDQRFDLQATLVPDTGSNIIKATFSIDGKRVVKPLTLSDATAVGVATGTKIATIRAVSVKAPGAHTFTIQATQEDGQTVTASGNLEVVAVNFSKPKRAKNLIIMIGDGMGAAHRTAARIVVKGVSQGKAVAPLNMDTFPNTAMIMTSSLNSIITDSSPGAACYSTGNKSNNNQQGVFPDDTIEKFDNPRVELIGEYFARKTGKSLGIVTTSDVFDATPGSFGTHTQDRGAGTGIVDQYFDDRGLTGLKVLMGGGRKWFLPASTAGSARSTATDYVLPPDLVNAYGTAPGVLDPERDLIGAFTAAGFNYAATRTDLSAAPADQPLLGLFALSNMNVSKDKIDGRRGTSTVVDDYGFPDQPLLDEMTSKALEVLSADPDGFVLMVEGASIDKQAHNMDTERWILDTIELDRAIGVAKTFATANPDTLVLVTADHECAGVSVIGASRVTNAELQTRAASGGGAAQLRTGVVGTYDAAGFPNYTIAEDGYPVSTDPDFKMLIGYAANADRYEDWLTNPLPLRDSQQPFNGVPPLSTYPSGPLNRDVAGNFLITGQVPDATAAHTANDIPLSAFGAGAVNFRGTIDNTQVFFVASKLLLGTGE